MIRRFASGPQSGFLAGLHAALDAGLDLIYPPGCLACDEVVKRAGAFCSRCDGCWREDTGVPGCPSCGAACAPFPSKDRRCPACRHLKLPVEGVVRLGAYGPALRALVSNAKFRGRSDIVPVVGEALALRVLMEPWGSIVEAVVPVPSSWLRRVVRPLHLPSELAVRIARRLHRPLVPLLERVGHPRPQTGLTVQARRNNVRGTFRMAPGAGVAGGAILVVDDVMTSRATVYECARVLRRAGAESVYAAAIAKTEPPRALPFIGMPA